MSKPGSVPADLYRDGDKRQPGFLSRSVAAWSIGGAVVVIREDRELLTELSRLNRDIAPLAMRMMEGSASAAEQQHYA
ncbi:MAG: hypothetical protein LC808_27330, partial [Actinobacteria bacterium]|nr:hypothetical protein [Actinomycetota bacterium]